ncbi:calcium uniporter protein 2, mitochondrial-like [Capsicum annuum]|uniref:calcium uniporter protein 2, mitochondrial-like n=1 Tax=Capsicum annuum TaxID=4072 RepID=UPI001FB19EB0|nr:calcium uniporter protein 2, mitochondrial-like [Capsicum annuum]XP_047258207.1 calcium uniporter protein 2, mitochondrial-like [Capsicum annuum]
MAFKNTLAQRLFNAYKTTGFFISACRISSSSMSARTLTPPRPDNKIAPDKEDNGILRRLIHRRFMYSSPTTSLELRSIPTGETLIEKLREMDISRSRIKLDGLLPPQEWEGKLTVADARKVLRLSQLEMVKLRLNQIEKSCISYSEFLQICSGNCLNSEQGIEFAKILDDSGTVIVLGDVVFIRPDQVVKSLQGLLPMPLANTNDPQMMEEFNQMEEDKAIIDKKAESLVRRELWCGLGYFVIQTAAFMRLTFWELSWDVMEPICFYVTSFYCMAGYTFFLKTSKEPSFEGFFQSRFVAKQKRLMKLRNFDLQRYNKLRGACYPQLSSPPGRTLTFN